jgi:hypothetical protein
MFKCFTSYRGWIALGLAILVGGYLAIRHGAHTAVALTFLVILACPLMHIFMHGGHGHHADRGASHDAPPASSGTQSKMTPDGG